MHWLRDSFRRDWWSDVAGTLVAKFCDFVRSDCLIGWSRIEPKSISSCEAFALIFISFPNEVNWLNAVSSFFFFLII